MYSGQPYNGPDTDLFGLGVILFIMYAHNPPFTEAKPDNPYYRRLYQNPQAFWEAVAEKKGADYFSPDFQDLVNKMLALEPQDRLSAMEILDHPWPNGETATKEQFVQEMVARKPVLIAHREYKNAKARFPNNH